MTYLVPRLVLLQPEDTSAASRFSSMVTLMLKCSRYHALLVSESLPFFESLSLHQSLLNVQKLSVTGTSNPCMAIFPIVRSILQGQRPAPLYTVPRSLIVGCEGSISSLRSAVASISSLISMPDNTMFDKVINSDTTSELFALFERILTSRQFCRSHYFRSIASPMKFELSTKDSKSMLIEVRCAIEEILRREIDSSTIDSQEALQWVLVLKAIINGELGSHEKAAEIFLLGGPPRWQNRHEMVQLARIALDSFDSIGPSQSKGQKLKSSSLSIVVPHVAGLVGTSCAVAIATSDESELLAYQNVGLQMLASLIKEFSGFADPKDTDSRLLDEHVSQIIPSIKQALSYDIDDSEDSIDTEGARELFLSGCECLQQLAKSKLIPDTHALRRLIKIILPSQDLLAFSSYPKNSDDDLPALHAKPTSFVDNRTSILLPRVASIWTIADIYMSGELGFLQPEHFDAVKSELSGFEDVLAINSSALSIDSCRLKTASAAFGAEEKSEQPSFDLKSGLTFLTMSSLDRVTIETMEKSSSKMACFGMCIILKLLKSESAESTKFTDLMSWTGRLLDVILSEFYRCMEIIIALDGDDLLSSTTAEECATCLFILCKVVGESNDLLSLEETRNVLSCVFKLIGFTGVANMNKVVNNDSEEKQDDEHSALCLSPDIAIRACAFAEAVSRSDKKSDVRIDLLRGVLKPLLAIEEIDSASVLQNPSNASILNSLLCSAQLVLEEGDQEEDIIKSLLHFSLQMLEMVDSCPVGELKTSIHNFIIFCLSGNAISDDETLLYIAKMAEIGCWDAWQLGIQNNSKAMLSSLHYVQVAIADHSNESNHIGALSVVLNVLKFHPDLASSIIESLCPVVLEIFHLYGTHKLQGPNRTIACATCMKVVMFTFSHICKEEIECAQGAAFLSIVFQLLVEIISYNGLPNSRKADAGSDPTLGRMSAQFFVHVLRTSPAMFKQCMGGLDVNIRSVLESSVRADMSGYASAAPVKKKLNLKSFKK